jgi:hypothetical protein
VSGSLAPRPLYPQRKSRWYPLKRPGGTRSWSGRFGGCKSPVSAGNRTPERSGRGRVSTSTKSRFSYNSTEIEMYAITDNNLQGRLIPVVTRSNWWVCGRLLAENEGSNLAVGMNVCLLCVMGVVR